VARALEPPQSPETMTPSQLARRQRLLEAVLALVAEGHDEELGMKDIAERAGVALGTVYRYFSSKDHLIAAALLEWASELERRTVRRPPPDGPPADRLVQVLRQALRAYQRQPTFARLLLLVANSTDPFASECFSQMGTVVNGTLLRTLPDVDPDVAERVLRIVDAVWYHSLVEWVNGRATIGEVHEMLESTCRLLLGDRVPATAPR
jgi:TetR/AcrR family transcriptional regulator, cholesterol catabolism regulator